MDAESTRNRLEKLKEEKVQQRREHKEREKKLAEQAVKMAKKRHGKSFWEIWGDYIGYAAMTLVILGLIFLNYTGDNRNLDQILVNDEAFIRTHNEGKHTLHTLAPNEYFQAMSLKAARKQFTGDLSARKIFTECSAGTQQSLPAHYDFYEAHPQCRFDIGERKDSIAHVEVPLVVYKERVCGRGLDARPEPSTAFFLQCNVQANKRESEAYLISTLELMTRGFVSEECWLRAGNASAPTACPSETLKDCPQERISGYCRLKGEHSIKAEIAQNGPVISVMRPYRDFLVYGSGVYDPRETSKLDGIIFVKLVGWGETAEGASYWLVDPMWGRTWGSNGIARVKRDFEDSLIEQYAFALYPREPAAQVADKDVNAEASVRLELHPQPQPQPSSE